MRGEGTIVFKNRHRMFKQHQVALFYPNMRHFWYKSDWRYWEFYWLTLDGPFAVPLTTALGLKPGIYEAGPAPAAGFQELLRLVSQSSKQAELQACATAFTILTQAAGSHTVQTDKLVNMALERISRDYVRPTFNIKDLITSLKIQRGVFCARFYAAMGMTPGDYLHKLRLQIALSMLKSSRLTCAEIARQCGYTDVIYFSRIIRRAVGRSPRQFRQFRQQLIMKKPRPERWQTA